MKTEYSGCNEHQDAEIHLQGETPTLCRVTHIVWKNWKRVSGVLCDRRMNVNIKGKVYRTVRGNTSTDVRGRDMGVEEGTGKQIGGRRNQNATMDVRSYQAGQDQK